MKAMNRLLIGALLAALVLTSCGQPRYAQFGGYAQGGQAGGDGTANTGGGGGGAWSNYAGGAGGSGIVILRNAR